jgi:hypothetical protein
MDRFRKGRTVVLHRSEQRKRGETQAFCVKLPYGDLQTPALLERTGHRGIRRPSFEGPPDGRKRTEHQGLVGVILVSRQSVKRAKS